MGETSVFSQFLGESVFSGINLVFCHFSLLLIISPNLYQFVPILKKNGRKSEYYTSSFGLLFLLFSSSFVFASGFHFLSAENPKNCPRDMPICPSRMHVCVKNLDATSTLAKAEAGPKPMLGSAFTVNCKLMNKCPHRRKFLLSTL